VSMLSSKPVECPPSLLGRAKRGKAMTVAVANPSTPLAMESVRDAHQHGLIEPVLVGSPGEISSAADLLHWDISDLRIEPASGEENIATVSATLAANQDVSAIMKGDIHTDVLMRAVIHRDSGLRTEQLMSHVFQMTIPGSEQALFITDAVLNVFPTLEQKEQIAKNAVSLLLALGYEKPKLAILSATETASSAMPSSEDAAELVQRARHGAIPNALVDGPMAFDLAVSLEASKIKRFDSEVAGHADILLVPNIETGNALFKMMVYFMSASAAGIVLGAKVPIILTSRADPTPARLASIALANIFANNQIRS